MTLKQAILNTNLKSVCDIVNHCQTEAEVLLKYCRYVKSTNKLITYLKDNQVKDKFKAELDFLRQQCRPYVLQTLHSTVL